MAMTKRAFARDDALATSDRIVLMEKGRVEVVDTSVSMCRRPPSRMVAEFMKETNIFHGAAALI
jgi:ABC-type Fe3+/spermidine/putrescine transport system ATPase subunit